MHRLQNDFNEGQPIDLGPYSDILSAALNMGFSTTDALEAALVCGTTDDVELICDYLLLPTEEKKRQYTQALSSFDEEEYEYYEEEAPQKPRPQPPPVPPHAIAANNNNNAELGTSEAYVNKQFKSMMKELQIPRPARPAMLELPIAKKLQLIQQHNRQKNPSAPQVQNVKKDPIDNPQNDEKQAKASVLGKHISSPVIIAQGMPRMGTIPIADAQKSFAQQKLAKPPTFSISQSAEVYDNNPKMNAMHKSRSMPPVKQQASNNNNYLGVEDPLFHQRNISLRADDVKDEDYGAYDDEYEYYDEYEQYEAPKAKAAQPNEYKPVKKVKKVKNVKVKLRVGSKVEVYSNSKGKWMPGKIIKIKKKLICVAYGANEDTQKWLEATSKNFRPLFEDDNNENLKAAVANAHSPALKPSNPSLAVMGNPSAKRLRNSVALQQKKQVKVKLRIGSAVEVFSVSNNRWIDGKLVGIKKDLIRVAYGKDFNTEKWLRANSKQFRPKLDMVDDAFGRKAEEAAANKNDYSIDNNAAENIGASGYLTHSLRREQYQMDAIPSVVGNNTKRGDLKIKIHGALQLRHNGNFAQITLSDHTLRTKKVATDQNPVWKEILRFSNFRPQIGKTAVVEIGNKSMLSEKIIASAEFELPIVFNRQEKMTIDISDSKKRLCGIAVLEQVVVEKGK